MGTAETGSIVSLGRQLSSSANTYTIVYAHHDPQLLAAAKQHIPHLHTHLLPIDTYSKLSIQDLGGNKFDFIECSHVLSTGEEEPLEVVQNLYQLLSDEGGLCVSAFARNSMTEAVLHFRGILERTMQWGKEKVRFLEGGGVAISIGLGEWIFTISEFRLNY